MHLLCIVVEVFIFICIARFVLQFLEMDGGGGWLTALSSFARTITEPVYSSVRKLLPKMGDLPVDFSPAVVIIVLGVVRVAVCH